MFFDQVDRNMHSTRLAFGTLVFCLPESTSNKSVVVKIELVEMPGIEPGSDV